MNEALAIVCTAPAPKAPGVALPALWQPAVPISQLTEQCLAEARKLKLALAGPIAIRNDSLVSAEELETIGTEHFARAVGRTIGARQWRRLFDRTLQRAGDSGRFDRLEIYLPDRLSKRRLAPVLSADDAEEFGDIVDSFGGCRDAARPNADERISIWSKIFRHHDRLQGLGLTPLAASRRLLSFLCVHGRALSQSPDAATRNSMQKLFWRWRGRFTAAGYDTAAEAAALRDRRKFNTGNHDGYVMPDSDGILIARRAVFNYRGDLSSAWRDLWVDRELSESTLAHYARGPRNKSRVPNKIRQMLRGEVACLTLLHESLRKFQLAMGSVRRSYDDIWSMQCVMADDFTMPVYFRVPDDNGGWKQVRGQCLLFIDFRSTRILGFSLQKDRNYSSVEIHTALVKVFEEFGVPSILYFENGIWRTSSVLKGRTQAWSDEEISSGLKGFGIDFIHARLPRTKQVERVGGLLQDMMEAEPGYCGRMEMNDCPETTRRAKLALEAGKPGAEEAFYTMDEWNARLVELVEKHNSTVHGVNAVQIPGLSPEQAFEKYLNHDNPQTTFSPRLRAYFATYKEIKTVTLNGITHRFQGRTWNYRGEALAKFIGQQAVLWFSPNNPSLAVVTDRDFSEQSAVVVTASEEPNALEALTGRNPGALSREMARINDQASHIKARYTIIKAGFQMPKRPTLASPAIVEICNQVETRRQEIVTEKREAQLAETRGHKRAKAIGIPYDPRARVEETPENEKDLRDLEQFMSQGRKKSPKPTKESHE